MASILRQIVAGPRIRHPEARLDLCYVTDEIIATSGPSSAYPKRAYRNPTDALVRFLDSKHGDDWSIWEFRAEGTGYPDDEVYGRIHHFPWPDHHPPPFALIPPLMASMRNWLSEGGEKKRVVVVHCKAGKGRSGTAACSYLISEEGWKAADALKQFTERRMRVGFGPGVSIPSQLRWVGYVDRWTNKYDKIYVERPVEIMEIHLWGLRHGVKVDVEGFVDEGRKIKRFHRFHRKERFSQDIDAASQHTTSTSQENETKGDGVDDPRRLSTESASTSSFLFQGITQPEQLTKTIASSASAGACVVLRPRKKIILPTSDVNIDLERRAVAAYAGWTMITSIGHIWFNAYFEGGQEHDSGVFTAEWDELDGIKGTYSKGARAFDSMKVVWRYHTPSSTLEAEAGTEAQLEVPEGVPLAGQIISEPGPGEEVPEGHATDWRGNYVVVEQSPGEADGVSDRQSQINAENIDPSPAPKPGQSALPRSVSPSPPPSRLATPSPSPSSPPRGQFSPTPRKLRIRRTSSPTAAPSLINVAGNVGSVDRNGYENEGERLDRKRQESVEPTHSREGRPSS